MAEPDGGTIDLHTLGPADLFSHFCEKSVDVEPIQKAFEILLGKLQLGSSQGLQRYQELKNKLDVSDAKSLWEVLDKKVKQKEYCQQDACKGVRVLIVGACPVKMRLAIECTLLGCEVVIVEKKRYFSYSSVLHLWPFTVNDLKQLGAMNFCDQFCTGPTTHISTRTLQSVMLKICLMFGIQIHFNIEFQNMLEPTDHLGWHAQLSPSNHKLNNMVFHVLIGAEGRLSRIPGFSHQQLKAKLMLVITARFVNHHSKEEEAVLEIGGVPATSKQELFKELKQGTGIDLEDLAYYKFDTHYFLISPKKESLLQKGVLKKDFPSTRDLLAPGNLNIQAMHDYSKEVANWTTKLSQLEFAMNHKNVPDVDLFDKSAYQAEYAACCVHRKRKDLLICLVGDSLLDLDYGCRFLSAMDTAWMIRGLGQGRKMLELLAERNSLHQKLIQIHPENMKNFSQYTIDPYFRYPSLHLSIEPDSVRHLYDTDDDVTNDDVTNDDVTDSDVTNNANWKNLLTEVLDVIDSLKKKHLFLTVRQVKLVLTGPPRVGKSTLKKRLMKEMINITGDPTSLPSTRLEKPQVLQVPMPICERSAFGITQSRANGDVSSWDWKELDLAKQISILLESMTVLPHKSAQQNSHISHDESSSHLSAEVESVPSLSGSTPEVPLSETPSELRKVVEDVVQKIDWEETRKSLRLLVEKMASVYVMDTGGQPEFHEVLPHVLQGPALHLILFSLEADEKDNTDCLDRHFKVEYVSEERKRVFRHMSIYPVSEVLFQLLGHFYSVHESQKIAQNLQKVTLKPCVHEPQAVLIGTYKDALDSESASKGFTCINQKLLSTFEGARFFENFLATVPPELCHPSVSGNGETFFVAVDNMHGTEKDVTQFRNFLAERIFEIALPVEVPCSVLLFHLLLRHHYEKDPGFCTIDECKKLAKKCEIPPHEVTKVLKYLHYTLGTILYYEDVDSLKDIVFCNPNLFLDQINQLITVCFTCGQAKRMLTKKARETGIIEPKLLDHVLRSSQKGNIIKYQQVIDFLSYSKLMVKIGGGDGKGEEKRFMPCLMLPNPDIAGISNQFLEELSVEPLLIQFPGKVIPLGLFTSLVVQLCQKEWADGKPWEAAEPKDFTRYRNQVYFLMQDSVLFVRLTARPCFIEVLVQVQPKSLTASEDELQKFCPRVRDHVEEAIKDTGLRCENFSIGFYCPRGRELKKTPHYAEVQEGSKVKCSQGGKECCVHHRFPLLGSLWFPKEKECTDQVCKPSVSSKVLIEDKSLSMPVIKRKICEAIAHQPAVIHHLADELCCGELITSVIQEEVKFSDGKSPYQKADTMINPVFEYLHAKPEKIAPTLSRALTKVGLGFVTTESCLIAAARAVPVCQTASVPVSPLLKAHDHIHPSPQAAHIPERPGSGETNADRPPRSSLPVTTNSLPEEALDASHLPIVRRNLRGLTDWQGLGLELGLDFPFLNNINKDQGGDVTKCKTAMLDSWLRAGNATKSTLVTALKFLGEYNMAANIQ